MWVSGIFFLEKISFSEHGVCKTQLKLTMQTSKWAPMGVKLIDFRRKSDVDDVGSLFEPICAIKNRNFFDFLPSKIISKSGPMQIHVEAQPKYACACEDPSETCVNRREI